MPLNFHVFFQRAREAQPTVALLWVVFIFMPGRL